MAFTVASESVLLYWRVGRRIRVDLLHEERAGYGQRIVSTVSRQLTAEYGRERKGDVQLPVHSPRQRTSLRESVESVILPTGVLAFTGIFLSLLDPRAFLVQPPLELFLAG